MVKNGRAGFILINFLATPLCNVKFENKRKTNIEKKETEHTHKKTLSVRSKRAKENGIKNIT